MKRLFVLLIALSQFACNGQPKTKLDFKVQCLPQHTYSQVVTRNSHSEVTYKGNLEFLTNLKAKGIINPTITDNKTEMQAISKTGKAINNEYPYSIEVVKTITDNGKKDPLDGMKAFGQVAVGGFKPKLDSIYAPGLSEDMKQQILPFVQNMMSQVSFPEKTLKIGDEFSQQAPLSFPIAGINIDMTITTTYKLVDILNDTANFDISQVYNCKADVPNHVIKASGEGKGKLTYDIKNNFYLLYQLETNIDNQLSFDNYNFEVKLRDNTIQRITIKAD